MEFDLGRLMVLATIARLGTMKDAASELSYTPSAISQQVHRLESEVGATVLERHPRGVSLTEAGHRVVAAAESISAQLVGLRNDLDDLAGARTGTLRLGVFPTFAASILPEVITRFRDAHPGVDLVVKSSRMAPLRQLLETRELDMFLIWDYPWNRVEDPALHVEELMTDETVLVLPRGHRLATRKSLTMGDLADESWVVREPGHPTREMITRCADAAGFEAMVRVEANDYPEVQAMIAAGFGVTLCPALATQPLREDVVVRALGPATPARRIRTARLADRAAGPLYQEMHATMQAVAHHRN